MTHNPSLHFITPGQRMLELMPRFFNGSDEDILAELFQNSRRAGSSRIDVYIETRGNQQWATIVDDGCGIFRDSVDIRPTDSTWDDNIRVSEDPAGCGLFALAHRGASIESNGKKIILTPEHFAGTVGYEVFEGCIVQGTQISYPIESLHFTKDFIKAVEQAARYLPIPVFLSNRQVPQQDFFTSKSVHYVETWNGVRIGITKPYAYNIDFNVNFHGRVFHHRLPCVFECFSYHTNRVWGVYLDVLSCTNLKLKLPDRKELFHNQFLASLLQEAERVLFRAIAREQWHALSYTMWRRALALGIQLPEAVPRLTAFEASCREEYPTVDFIDIDPLNSSDFLVINPSSFSVHDETIQRALYSSSDSHPDQNAVCCQPEFDGYSWYDAIPKLVNAKATFLWNDCAAVVANGAVNR